MGKAWLKALRADALSAQRGLCYYCRNPLAARQATADHKDPVSKGGCDERHNICAACAPCNVAKGDLTEGQFLSIIKKPPQPDTPLRFTMAWSRRKIGVRTERVCERIDRMVM